MKNIYSSLLALCFFVLVPFSAHAGWNMINSPEGLYHPSAIASYNESVIVAAGDEGIWRSLDQSSTWMKTSSILGIKDVKFISPQVGYAISAHNIFKSNNAGMSWFLIHTANDSISLKRICVGMGSQIFVLYTSTDTFCGVLQSSDGLSWSGYYIGQDENGLNGCLTDAQGKAFVFGQYEVTIKNAAGQWSSTLRSDNLIGNTNASYVGNRLIIAGRKWDGEYLSAGISWSADQGSTWTAVSLDSSLDGTINDLAFEGIVGFAVGSASNPQQTNTKGRIYSSLDGGQHWQQVFEASDISFISVCGNGISAYALSDDGHVAKNTYTVTGVTSQLIVPQEYALKQNYPNPFNPSTSISFTVAKNSHLRLSVFDAAGHEVKVLVNGYKNAGSYTETFDGSSLASGVYFYRLESSEYSATKKMMLVK